MIMIVVKVIIVMIMVIIKKIYGYNIGNNDSSSSKNYILDVFLLFLAFLVSSQKNSEF